MDEKRDDALGHAIICTIAKNAGEFRYGHAWVLVGLAVALVISVCCEDWELFPRWQTYVLVILLVVDALTHARINAQFVTEERQAWEQVLSLAATFHHHAGSEDALSTEPAKQDENTADGSQPNIRAFLPGERATRGGA
jgi:hypothetical protein